MWSRIWSQIWGGIGLGRPAGSSSETLCPRCPEDLHEILTQVRENRASVRVTGGTFPFHALPEDILVDLRRMDRLVGLDIYQQIVTVEPGMKISVLTKLLETVSLSLAVFGRIPDLAVGDALATGLFGATGDISSSLLQCQVMLASGKLVHWNWDTHPREMKSLACGLGMAAIPVALTFQCLPAQSYGEISYLNSMRDILDGWAIQVKSSFCLQLHWYPFSELAVVTHLNPTDQYHMAPQPALNRLLERTGEFLARTLRHLRVSLYHTLPAVSAILARAQLFMLWSVAKQRSDYVHHIPRLWASPDASRGSVWLIPLIHVPTVLRHISRWTQAHPRVGVAPMFLQTVKPEWLEEAKAKAPFMSPLVHRDASCALWYDWFLPECDPDPIAVASFEAIFHEVGGSRAWFGERLTSPLVLSDTYDQYPQWCRMKAKLDPHNVLQSAYIQGTVYSQTGLSDMSESTLSLCSSIVE